MHYRNGTEAGANHSAGTAGRRDYRRVGRPRRRQGANHRQADRGATGEVIWAQSFERDLRDVLALQSEVARAITSKVDITLTPQEQARLASARPVDPEVHRQVLLGRHHAAKATEEGLRKGHSVFRRRPSPRILPTRWPMPVWQKPTWGCPASTWTREKRCRKRSGRPRPRLRLDESLADAHAALGYVHLVYDWDGPAAEKALLRALDLNPDAWRRPG